MKRLLVATAAIEAGAGLALLCGPSVSVALLLGSPLTTEASAALGRVAGAALLALGIASWLARNEQNAAANGLIAAMTVYNAVAMIILGAAGLQLRPVGVALWPAVGLHAVMTAWCVTAYLLGTQSSTSRSASR
jgi:hypothetical protein